MTNENVKSIGYAYPTSINARKLGRCSSGCYIVQKGPFLSPDKEAIGPFDRLEDAEACAEDIQLPWDPNYLRFPMKRAQETPVQAQG